MEVDNASWFRTFWDGLPYTLSSQFPALGPDDGVFDTFRQGLCLIKKLEQQPTLADLYRCLQSADWPVDTTDRVSWLDAFHCTKLDVLNRAWRVPTGLGDNIYGFLSIFISEVITAGNPQALEFLLQYTETTSMLIRTSALISALGSANVEVVELVLAHWFPTPFTGSSYDLADCISVARISSLEMFRFIDTAPFFSQLKLCQHIFAFVFTADELEAKPGRIEVMKHVFRLYPINVSSYLFTRFSTHNTVRCLKVLTKSPQGGELVLSSELLGISIITKAILHDDIDATEWLIQNTNALANTPPYWWAGIASCAVSIEMCALLFQYGPAAGIRDFSMFTNARLADLVERNPPVMRIPTLSRCLRMPWLEQAGELVSSLCAVGTVPDSTDLQAAKLDEGWNKFLATTLRRPDKRHQRSSNRGRAP